MFDIHTDVICDEASFRSETGLSPGQVIDMLALMGDSVDNVPGVEGVGDKTAMALIAQYGSLENVIAKAAEIKGKRGENIRAAAALLPLSRQLVTLRHDAPAELGPVAGGAGQAQAGEADPDPAGTGVQPVSG
jgi:DNA polymerase-1